uniref:Uncharacterized protein n=1 Tax=Trichobilharzia regenti TaxID=157069 RepID=A0AA85K790_TRIRE
MFGNPQNGKNIPERLLKKKFSVIVTGDWNLDDLHNEYDWTKYYEQDIRDVG